MKNFVNLIKNFVNLIKNFVNLIKKIFQIKLRSLHIFSVENFNKKYISIKKKITMLRIVIKYDVNLIN